MRQQLGQLDQLMSDGNGLATYSMLRSHFTADEIRTFRISGRLILLGKNVYRASGIAIDEHFRLRAAVMMSGTNAFASHRSACRLWGFNIATSNSTEVTIPHNRRLLGVDWKIHRSNIPALFIAQKGGIPVSNPERTLLEVSRFRADKTARRVLEDAVIRKIVDLDRLVKTRNVMRALGRRRFAVWTRVLPELIPELRAVQTSAEGRAVEAWRRANLEIPIPQYKVIMDGIDNYLDFAYPNLKIAIEIDDTSHDVLRAAKDRRRDRWLRSRGWEVIRFPNAATDHELVGEVKEALHIRRQATA